MLDAMKACFRGLLRGAIIQLAALVLYVALLPFVLVERWKYFGKTDRQDSSELGPQPRLFFGATSIITLPKLAAALRAHGYVALSGAVSDVGFHVPDGFDKVVRSSASPNILVRRLVGTLEASLAFIWALRQADIFHLYLDGGFLRRTPLQLWELHLLKLAGKKIVVFPYGSDAWALGRVPDPVYRAALLADYPSLGARSAQIGQRLDRFCGVADIVVGCLCHIMVLPRYDTLMLTCYGVETDEIAPIYPDTSDAVLRLFHAPNHRHCKGSDILERAVAELKAEGVGLELDLVQKRPRDEVMRRMSRAHVVVDQLLAGYGMTALEGMALGKIVITGRNWPAADEPFRTFAPFKECPLHWAGPETIKATLRDIALRRDLWRGWGQANRRYVERYHSPSAMADQWSALYPRLGFAARLSDRARS